MKYLVKYVVKQNPTILGKFVGTRNLTI